MIKLKVHWIFADNFLRLPKDKERCELENIALGVIYAHHYEKSKPPKCIRTIIERSSEEKFDPVNGEGTNIKKSYREIRDKIFSLDFEENLLKLEVFYCWNDLSNGQKTDEFKSYRVEISTDSKRA